MVKASAVLVLAGCGASSAKPVQPLARGAAVPGQAVFFKTITGMVKGADSVLPKCPVRAHFEAELTVAHMAGKLQYRWERSTGENTPLRELTVPAAAGAGNADIAVEPDEWPVTKPGVQMNFSSRVHIVYPLEAYSPVIDVQAKCY